MVVEFGRHSGMPWRHATMPSDNQKKVLDKTIDFGKQLLGSVLRSRTGALSEMAKLLRFQSGTKGFEREYNRLVSLVESIKESYKLSILAQLPSIGLRLGIVDDSDIEKSGKTFPKQQIHRNSDGSFYSGMKALASAVYQNGKVAVVSSRIVGKEDNKLKVAEDEIDQLIDDFLVEIFLFDSWYCKNPLINHIKDRGRLFISRLRKNTKAVFDEDQERLDAVVKGLPHSEYERVSVCGKPYWVKDVELTLNSYGKSRVIISKEGVHDNPIFLLTNAESFSATFIVKLYLRRFSIEIFFKDAKQFLNFETFLCRKECKWDLHLLLTNILHWAIQRKKSISKTVREIRENIADCLLFINENLLLKNFFEELRKRCLT
jgi:IS4 transposase